MTVLILPKTEVATLLDMAQCGSAPTGILDFHLLKGTERTAFEDRLVREGLINSPSRGFRPDKGLDPFLLPIVNRQAALIYQHGTNDTPDFNISAYFFRGQISVLMNQSRDTVKWLTLASWNDFALFLRKFPNHPCEEQKPQFIGCVFLTGQYSLLHTAQLRLQESEATVRVREGRRWISNEVEELDTAYAPFDYNRLLEKRIEELYDIAGH